MRSPQTIGVEPESAGSGSFQVMFSVADHETGRFFSALIPFADGPLHWGQFSAATRAGIADKTRVEAIARRRRLRFMVLDLGGGVAYSGLNQ